MDAWLQRIWYGRSAWAWLFSPLALLYGLISGLRRWAFAIGLLKRIKVDKPVIVIGNITVGGSGKTPLVIWLVQQLQQRGLKPAVITRGYGGASRSWPRDVTLESDAREVGDEAVLIASRTRAIVVAGPDRVADAERAIKLGADVIVSDDGLQHYRLMRDLEVAVVDGARGFGNGWLLPAGPLREPTKRLRSVDAIVVTERGAASKDTLAGLKPLRLKTRLVQVVQLTTGAVQSLSSFRERQIHAVAGIGHPEAFFAGLRGLGIRVDARPLRDHAALTPAELQFGDALPVFMTEKDAVKCRSFADARCWVVPLDVEIEEGQTLLARIETILALR